MATAFENYVQQLVDEKKIPNAIFYASDATGAFHYHSTFGYASFEPDAQPMTADTYMWAASCTKLLTSISIMRLVEEGRLDLDGPVYDVLPELAELKIIKRAEPVPEYETPKNKITYRHLLSHTSGLGYDFIHPLLIAWRQQHPRQPGPVPKLFNLPLAFEPGTAWLYGCGLDWAGLAVERVTGMKLSQYMEKIIFMAVGVEQDAISFFPLKVPGSQFATMAQRLEDGTYTPGSQGTQDPSTTEYCYGGQGTFIRGGGYLKILQSLLAEDEKMLKRATVVEMFRPQLSAAQKKGMDEFVFSSPILTRVVARGSRKGEIDHCLCGIVDTEGKPGWRGKGTVAWGGAPNLTWFLDRENAICGFKGAQLMPAGDPVYVEISLEFEKAMCKLAGKIRSGI
ncbi:beta-lactamase/transpeptidase-like protein [Cryphonectria parasitica EP155]|uniref:Beta-lactamase/transpeptidase-like protein n=1 Tax=Cryphonectria parasitica (strain ATCC 38755 / EP155) TaxID=660469 RepID=A0A9P4Y435_CRYP1|nr:beta-lactamase/transpeptidase-like protein [Cryphonectria parasitica EP155]KAF3766333.1 beta-lactamase/transpeptidase-like protein [Cryphonectria parasitica EP155]